MEMLVLRDKKMMPRYQSHNAVWVCGVAFWQPDPLDAAVARGRTAASHRQFNS
jgi:hypothetical protein